jgi:invasion protein IalB
VKPNASTLNDKDSDNKTIEAVVPFKQNVKNLMELSIDQKTDNKIVFSVEQHNICI